MSENLEELKREFIKLCLDKDDDVYNNKKIFHSVEYNDFHRSQGYNIDQLYEVRNSEFKNCVSSLEGEVVGVFKIEENDFCQFDKSMWRNIYIGNALNVAIFNFKVEVIAPKDTSIFLKNCIFNKGLTILTSGKAHTIRFENCHFNKDVRFDKMNCDIFCFQTEEYVEFSGIERLRNFKLASHNGKIFHFGNNKLRYSPFGNMDGIDKEKSKKITFNSCDIGKLDWSEKHLQKVKVCIENSKVIHGNIRDIRTERKSDKATKWNILNTIVSTIVFDAGKAGYYFKSSKIRAINGKKAKASLKIKGYFDDLSISDYENFDEVILENISLRQRNFRLQNIDSKLIEIKKFQHFIDEKDKQHDAHVEIANTKKPKEGPVSISILDTIFEGRISFKNLLMGNNIFKNANFKDSLSFSNVTFENYPRLYGSNFSRSETCDLDFIDCKYNFWDSDLEYAEESFRSIKNQSRKTNYEYGEHLFTAFELRARNKKLKWSNPEKWFGQLGWFVNEFGKSLSKPLFILIVLGMFFAITYHCMGLVYALSSHGELVPETFEYIYFNKTYCWSEWIPSLRYSLDNTLFFTKIFPGKRFYAPTAWGYVLGIFQIIISASLLYLFITGIKKRFRQK